MWANPHREECSSMSFRLLVVWLLLASASPGQTVHAIGDIFKPLATPALAVRDLSYLVFAICAVIFVIVAGLLTYALFRFRRRAHTDNTEPPQVYGSNQIEIAWTVIPILIVFVLTMATSRVIAALQDKSQPANALQVTVIGHQWWWEIRYPGFSIVTANEMHVPVSKPGAEKPVFLTLESADVAHSFWVPQLSGKTDVIPNRANHMWLDPRETGVYYGNCAEYCGTQHANMLIRVVADTAEDFDKWTASQQKVATADPSAAQARDAFLGMACVNCHTVRGTPAHGTFGPDLTHVMSRGTLASGMIPNSRGTLFAWVGHPQAIKPGNLMPDMQLNNKELAQVAAYLSTLR
jgi:cytochrome c oxidase subunit 2